MAQQLSKKDVCSADQQAAGWLSNSTADNIRLEKAIIYAVEKHSGQCRKGTNRPYITHPLETMQILLSMNADTNLLIAGVLHDVVEDTSATAEDIRSLFGNDVASLVAAHSEDKSKTWKERKIHTIKETTKAGKRLKTLIMADTVSNLRCIAADYAQIGDALWHRFNAPTCDQAWYYSGIQDALFSMQSIPECAGIYWEMVALYKDLFVCYYLAPEMNVLYQVCMDGTAYYLQKGTPEWKQQTTKIPQTVLSMKRQEAEKLEDQWNEPFWQLHEKDLEDATYSLYSSRKRCFDIKICERKLTLNCCDFGAGCSAMSGKDEYEFFYQLDEESTHRFLTRFRIEYGTEASLETLLAKAFGTDAGTVSFREFCKNNGIKYRYISI